MIAWAVTAGGCAALVWSGLPWARALAGSRPGRWPLYGLGYLTGTALVTLGLLLVSLAGLPIGRLTLAAGLDLRAAHGPPVRRPHAARRGAGARADRARRCRCSG